MDNGDTGFPSSRSLRVPFVFVPKGSPPPLEWMAAHPNYVTIPAVFIPRPRPEPDMGLEPQPKSEGQAAPLPEKPTYEVEIDYAGNWIIKGVTVMMPRQAPQTEPPSAQQQEARPPGPILDPQPRELRPDYLRHIPPPGPRRAPDGPPPLGPNPAAGGIDPLSPEFTRNLMRQTTRIMAGMERFSGPVTYPTMHTPEGLSAAVRTGMRHLAAHKGDVHATLASAKAAGAGHGSKPAADHTDFAVAASATANGAKFLSEVAAGLEAAAGVAETAGIGVSAAMLLDPTPAGAGEEQALRAYRAGHGGTAEAHGFEPPPPSPPLPGLVPPPLPKTKPGEGGFTQAAASRPSPGFTPAPSPVLVHPGREAEANKPIVVEAKRHAGRRGAGSGVGQEGTSSRGVTPHAAQRQKQAQSDPARQVGDPNRVMSQGRKFLDRQTGNTIYVDGDRAIVVNSSGEQITQFTNSRANTQARILSGRWIPQ